MWDLTANACSCELVPEIGTAVRSLTVAMDGSLIVAANNHGTCYVWRMMRGAMPSRGILLTCCEEAHLRWCGAGALGCQTRTRPAPERPPALAQALTSRS